MRYTNLSDYSALSVLRLARSDNVGPVTFFSLMQRYGSPDRALEALPELSRRGGRKKALQPCGHDQAEREIAAIEQQGASLLLYGQSDYPAALLDMYDPPPILIARGDSALLNKQPAIAIVGGRNASAVGQQAAKQLSHACSQEGLVVVSGLARGIDAAAHKGALEGGTIAVIGTGIDICYPKENQSLRDAIAEQGIMITEYAPGTQANAFHFPARNRIIAGLSKLITVIEASPKSGSLITARLALDYGREVGAVPGSPMDSRNSGCNRLIKEGAHLIEDVRDIRHALPASSAVTMPHQGQAEQLGEHVPLPANDEGLTMEMRASLLEALGPTPVSMDELCRLCGLPPNHVLTLLMELELAGKITRYPGHRVARAA